MILLFLADVMSLINRSVIYIVYTTKMRLNRFLLQLMKKTFTIEAIYTIDVALNCTHVIFLKQIAQKFYSRFVGRYSIITCRLERSGEKPQHFRLSKELLFDPWFYKRQKQLFGIQIQCDRHGAVPTIPVVTNDK